MLNAAAQVLWREANVVQLELGARRVILENISSPQLAALLRPAAASASDRPDDEEGVAASLCSELTELGFVSAPPEAEIGAGLGFSAVTAAQLVPDLAALQGSFGDQAAAILRRRHATSVTIHGASRLTVALASTLAGAGIGTIRLSYTGQVRAAEACPGGLSPSDEGKRFSAAAAAVIQRCAPAVRTAGPDTEPGCNLAILTDPGPIDNVVRDDLHQQRQPHLIASVEGHRAVIGPLVVPGESSCLRCADLQRTDRDPAWPLLAVQLSNRARRRLAADLALAVATAGVTATQALAFIDQPLTCVSPATSSGTLEWQLPDWRLRRRSWAVHPDCDCGAFPAEARAKAEWRM